MKKRVFYIDPQSYNNLSVYDMSLLEHIDSCEMHYFCNVKNQCERLPHVAYHSLFAYSDLRGWRKGISYVGSILMVMWQAVRLRPAAVHIQWFRLFAIDSLLIRLLRAMGIRIIHTAHNVLPHNPRRGDKAHYAWLYAHCDHIITHTHRSKSEIMERFGIAESKLHVIPHGVLPASVPSADVDAKAAELSQQLHTEGKTVFASMGYQNYYKGIDIISDTWMKNKALCQNPNCMLLIVGKVQNADLSPLQSIANVTIVDRMVSNLEFEAYLRLASVVLLPYREISQSGVLLTAIQRGLPVVVSDVGGLTEPFGIANVGWNIGKPTVDTLSETLVALAADPSRIARCRQDKASFAAVRQHYSWKNIAHATQKLYVALLMLLFTLIPAIASAGGPVLWDLAQLQKQQASRGAAYRQTVALGRQAAAKPLLSVVQKTKVMHGDVHNYESLAYYAWPDPANPGGKYIIKDGQPSPEYKLFDAIRMYDVCQQVKALTQAYYVSRDTLMAARAVAQVRCWFLDADTYMNPNLAYGQFVPGLRNGNGHPGAITEAYNMLEMLDAIELLHAEQKITEATMKQLRQWFAQLSKWLQTSSLGKEMSKKDNNHAVMYDVLLYRISMFTGDNATRKRVRKRFTTVRLPAQIAADGRQPAELKRPRAMYYSLYNLQHILEFCLMQHADGKFYYQQQQQRIDAALQYVARYIDHRDQFPYQETGSWEQCRNVYTTITQLMQRVRAL